LLSAVPGQLVEQKLEKIVLNVAGNVLSPSDNALDVFRMGPGVTVDSHNQIKLNGKSVTVLVDGRTVPGGPQATSNYLTSLPANPIREVEIISNPTSQYDAGGGAAVINIIPKKITQDGLRGNIYSGYDYSRFNSANLFSSLSVKKGKTPVTASPGTNMEASNQRDANHNCFSQTAQLFKIAVPSSKESMDCFLTYLSITMSHLAPILVRVLATIF
jgi:hypothetical protein